MPTVCQIYCSSKPSIYDRFPRVYILCFLTCYYGDYIAVLLIAVFLSLEKIIYYRGKKAINNDQLQQQKDGRGCLMEVAVEQR